MKLFAVEKQNGGNWKTVALHKARCFRTLHSKMESLVSLPTCRIKRVLTADDATRIISQEHPAVLDIKNTESIEWV